MPASIDPTRTTSPSEAPTAAGRGSTPSSFPGDDARFPPGTMVGARYRVVSLLGRGGMGEVYRADDLKLGQVVALKFLPETLERDPQRLERFLNEVRVALRVSHPNVCRVYDVGEVDGRHFISMEFVDGEDLASLLRRIGRFPEDRATRVARQLCAGVAAAHDRGVLHRDLKPANVMIDGQGQVKITDFGLSSTAARVEGAEARAGTPAYMAPEQLQGREATVQSDVYALGLVLYELFTGERAFVGATLDEVARRRSDTTPASMTSRVDTLDPAIERIVDRCLQDDPQARPPGALAVAAALPGGDPLAAALAAGETPSPEMVANAAGTPGMRPALAFGCVAGTLLLMALLAAARDAEAPSGEAPEKLAVEAEQILAASGVEPARYSEWRIDGNRPLLEAIAEGSTAPDRWDALADDRLPGMFFWRRWSPEPLVSTDLHRPYALIDDPPQFRPGSATVALDMQGRLLLLDVIPSAGVLENGAGDHDPWSKLFDEAGLDITRFAPAEPSRRLPSDCDRTAAWTGVVPSEPATPVTVQACTHRGHPVYFAIHGEWGRPTGAYPRMLYSGAFLFLLVGMCVAGSGLAYRNVRLGRSDPRGASWLFLGMLALYLAEGVVLTRVSQTGLAALAFELTLGPVMAHGLVHAFSVGVFYLAIEPYARKLWPRSLVSWARLAGGRLRDPLVGGDIVAGGVGGAGIVVVAGLILGVAPLALGRGSLPPVFTGDTAVAATDVRGALAGVLSAAMIALLAGLTQFFALLLGRLLLRNRWAAAVFSTLPTTAIVSTVFVPYLPESVGALAGFSGGLIIAYLLVRRGLVAALVARFVSTVMLGVPTTLDLSSWYADTSAVAFASVAAVLGYGAWIAVGRQEIWRDPLRKTG